MINTKIKREVKISAVVNRADGTIEDLGVISYWHRNPILRFVNRLRYGIWRIW